MSLREIVDRYAKGSVIETPAQKTSSVARTVAALEVRFEKLAQLPAEEQRLLWERVREAAARGDWTSIGPKDLKRTADLLFEGDSKLVRFPGLLKGYLAAVEHYPSRGALLRLVSAYCVHFDPKHPGIRAIARFLVSKLLEMSQIWMERHQAVGFFDPAKAPSRIAAGLLDHGNPREGLSQLGLVGRRGSSGIAAHVFCKVADTVRLRLEQDGGLGEVKRLIRWGSADGKTLLFESEKAALANALLLPWRQRPCSLPVRREVERFLLATLRDPRLHLGQWASVDDSAKIVMRRWLAENSLEQFLRVVDRVAPTYQWTHRRAFWNAYFKKGFVLDAWVAFGREGARLARSVSDGVGDEEMAYGELVRPPNIKQAVLFLRIGDLLVADWSHLGSVRIWRRDNENAPELYAPHYGTSSLRQGCDFEDTHDQHGHWQAQTHAFIERHTGIRLERSSYMPSGWRG
jgi:hypothetical protein